MEKRRHILRDGVYFANIQFSDKNEDILLPWIYQKEGRDSSMRVSEVHVQKKADGVYSVALGMSNSGYEIKGVGAEDRIRLVEGDFSFDDVARYGANTPVCVANPESKVCSR